MIRKASLRELMTASASFLVILAIIALALWWHDHDAILALIALAGPTSLFLGVAQRRTEPSDPSENKPTNPPGSES